MDNQTENIGWSDASLPDLDSDQYSDFEVIESNLEVGDDMKTEEIPVPREKSSHEDSDGGHKIPKILINSVELNDEQMKPPNPRNRRSKKSSSPASSAGSGTSNDNTTSAAKPKQMSIMAFEKKEEALEKRITTSLPSSLLGKIGDYKRENPTILSCEIRERLISEGKYLVVDYFTFCIFFLKSTFHFFLFRCMYK